MTQSERSFGSTVGSSIFSEKSEKRKSSRKSSKPDTVRSQDSLPELEIIDPKSRKSTERSTSRVTRSSKHSTDGSMSSESRKPRGRSEQKPSKRNDLLPRESLLLIPNGNVSSMKKVWENKSSLQLDYRNWTKVNESYLKNENQSAPIQETIRTIPTDRTVTSKQSTSRRTAQSSRSNTKRTATADSLQHRVVGADGDCQENAKSYVRFWNKINAMGMTLFLNLYISKKKSTKIIRLFCLTSLLGIILRHTSAFDCVCFAPLLGTISLLSLTVMILFDK